MTDNDLRDALADAVIEASRCDQWEKDIPSRAGALKIVDACIEVIKKWQADEPESPDETLA